MSQLYKRIGNYNLVKNGELFGLTDSEGEVLLPCEYDSIFYEGGGFIITKNSKSGYIRFHEEIPPHDKDETVFGYPEKYAKLYLPCVYDRIQPTRNGLVLYSMTSEAYSSEKRAWLDYKSEKLYENLYFMRNLGDFDEFLDTNREAEMQHLKRAGEDYCVYIPFDLSVNILYEIPLYNDGAHYFVCSEELPEEEAKRKGYGYEYFFMIVLLGSYTFTEPKTDLKEIFNDFPRIIATWEKQAKTEKEHKEYKKGKKKNGKHKTGNI